MNTHILSLLPAEFEHEIESCEIIEHNNWKAVIHTECNSSEMCDKWVSEFSSSSLCTWRVRKTYPNRMRGIVFRKDYICQHSSFNKKHPKRHNTKDSGCSARLSVKVIIASVVIIRYVGFTTAHCYDNFRVGFISF